MNCYEIGLFLQTRSHFASRPFNTIYVWDYLFHYANQIRLGFFCCSIDTAHFILPYNIPPYNIDLRINYRQQQKKNSLENYHLLLLFVFSLLCELHNGSRSMIIIIFVCSCLFTFYLYSVNWIKQFYLVMRTCFINKSSKKCIHRDRARSSCYFVFI